MRELNTDDTLEITGANLIDVVKAAYDLSKPVGMGFMHYTPEPLTDDEARELINGDRSGVALSLDYVKGRACKLVVFKDEERLFVRKDWYDHSDSDLDKLIAAIKL